MAGIPGWMSNSHYIVLLALNSSDMINVYSPTAIADNVPARRETVQDALSDLVDHECAEKVERGKYKINQRGRDFLAGELDASELEEDENG